MRILEVCIAVDPGLWSIEWEFSVKVFLAKVEITYEARTLTQTLDMTLPHFDMTIAKNLGHMDTAYTYKHRDLYEMKYE